MYVDHIVCIHVNGAVRKQEQNNQDRHVLYQCGYEGSDWAAGAVKYDIQCKQDAIMNSSDHAQ